MRYLQVFEKFEAKILTNFLNYLKSKGVRDATNFLHDIRGLMKANTDIDKIKPESFKYLPAKKALKLNKSIEDVKDAGPSYMKFWFDVDGNYIAKTITKSAIDIMEYDIVKYEGEYYQVNIMSFGIVGTDTNYEKKKLEYGKIEKIDDEEYSEAIKLFTRKWRYDTDWLLDELEKFNVYQLKSVDRTIDMLGNKVETRLRGLFKMPDSEMYHFCEIEYHGSSEDTYLLYNEYNGSLNYNEMDEASVFNKVYMELSTAIRNADSVFIIDSPRIITESEENPAVEIPKNKISKRNLSSWKDVVTERKSWNNYHYKTQLLPPGKYITVENCVIHKDELEAIHLVTSSGSKIIKKGNADSMSYDNNKYVDGVDISNFPDRSILEDKHNSGMNIVFSFDSRIKVGRTGGIRYGNPIEEKKLNEADFCLVLDFDAIGNDNTRERIKERDERKKDALSLKSHHLIKQGNLDRYAKILIDRIDLDNKDFEEWNLNKIFLRDLQGNITLVLLNGDYNFSHLFDKLVQLVYRIKDKNASTMDFTRVKDSVKHIYNKKPPNVNIDIIDEIDHPDAKEVKRLLVESSDILKKKLKEANIKGFSDGYLLYKNLSRIINIIAGRAPKYNLNILRDASRSYFYENETSFKRRMEKAIEDGCLENLKNYHKLISNTEIRY